VKRNPSFVTVVLPTWYETCRHYGRNLCNFKLADLPAITADLDSFTPDGERVIGVTDSSNGDPSAPQIQVAPLLCHPVLRLTLFDRFMNIDFVDSGPCSCSPLVLDLRVVDERRVADAI
jgi:hypothetical protein